MCLRDAKVGMPVTAVGAAVGGTRACHVIMVEIIIVVVVVVVNIVVVLVIVVRLLYVILVSLSASLEPAILQRRLILYTFPSFETWICACSHLCELEQFVEDNMECVCMDGRPAKHWHLLDLMS